MRFIVRTTGERDISELKKQIPDLIVVNDRKKDAMDTFFLALEASEDDDVVHLEDDVILCNNFVEKVKDVIRRYPNEVIQFFSMRKDDLTIGTRYIAGYRFLANVCFYLPKGMSKDILNWSKGYKQSEGMVKGAWCDVLVADYFKEKKIRYLNWCPNLADHAIGKSLIGPRSSKRVSKTFVKG